MDWAAMAAMAQAERCKLYYVELDQRRRWWKIALTDADGAAADADAKGRVEGAFWGRQFKRVRLVDMTAYPATVKLTDLEWFPTVDFGPRHKYGR